MMLKEERFVRDMVRRTCINGDTRAATKAITALVRAVREDCATVALEQRCERETSWDRACTTIAAAIRRK